MNVFSVYDKDGNEIGLRFLVLSDWGGDSHPPYTTHTQMNVGKGLATTAANFDCSFVLSLGDNFCNSGVQNVDDLRFEVRVTLNFPFLEKASIRAWSP